MDIENIASTIGLKQTEKHFTTPFNPVFVLLLIVKSFEILRKNTVHNLLFLSFSALN